MADYSPRDRESRADVIPLSELSPGRAARLHETDVEGSIARFLHAMGLTRTAELRLCKSGEPCIIQVRSTRIGLARSVARRIYVVPVTGPGAE